jgi:hypothetical protein
MAGSLHSSEEYLLKFPKNNKRRCTEQTDGRVVCVDERQLLLDCDEGKGDLITMYPETIIT